jgi:DNA adenine methylase
MDKNNVNGKIPHLVQHQGSKIILAPSILQYLSKQFNRLIEPFSGMDAISITVANENRASFYQINENSYVIITFITKVVLKK